MGDGSVTPEGGNIEGFDQKTETPIASGSDSGVSVEGGGATQQTPAYVTDEDVSESFQINQMTADGGGESGSVNRLIGEISPANAPSTKEFAEQTFAEGTQARRLTAGMTGREATIAETGRNIGGWKTFTQESIVNREGLSSVGDVEGGSTEGFMDRVQLSEGGDTAATEAYVTKYNHNKLGNRNPSMENAHSQMAVYAGLDAMGVETPRHAFDAESKEVFVEGVSRPGYEATTAEAHNLPQDHADKIDPEQLKDVMAANMILGNVDVNAENLMVGEDGTVISFDYDYSETFGQLRGNAAERAESWVDDAVSQINAVRSDEINMDADDVADRAEELATQLDESGMVDQVIDAVGEYDEFFADESTDMYPDTDNPVDTGENGMAFRVHKHVTNWSTANDDIVVAGL